MSYDVFFRPKEQNNIDTVQHKLQYNHMRPPCYIYNAGDQA